MDASAPTAAFPEPALRRTVIEATFALLYAQDPATAELAKTMNITTTTGATVVGAEKATAVLLEALEADPDGFAAWLSDSEQTKIGLSLAIALLEETRSVLATHDNTEKLLAQLHSIDGQRIHAVTWSNDAAKRPAVIDLTDQTQDVKISL